MRPYGSEHSQYNQTQAWEHVPERLLVPGRGPISPTWHGMQGSMRARRSRARRALARAMREMVLRRLVLAGRRARQLT